MTIRRLLFVVMIGGVLGVAELHSGKAARTPDTGALAPTPPMGWNIVEQVRLRCQRGADPRDGGRYRRVGHEGRRLPVRRHRRLLAGGPRRRTARIVSDPKRFAAGMKALADYVHAKGLKFGIYSDAGTQTCAGQAGQPRLRDQGRAAVRRVGRRLPEIRLVQHRRHRRPSSATPTMRKALVRHRPADRLQHVRVGTVASRGRGREARAPVAHDRRHPGLLGVREETMGLAERRGYPRPAGRARAIRRPRSTGTTPTCSRSATAG